MAVDYDVLHRWDWNHLNREPEKLQLDGSWVPLRWSNEPLSLVNYKYSFVSQGRLICASHQEDDTYILMRSAKGNRELKRWSLGRRWDCERLRNSQNGKFVAVHLYEKYKSVLADKNRNDKGRHRMGIICDGSDEIRWVSTIYKYSIPRPNISSIAVSEDGKYLAAVGTDNGGFIHLADVAQKKVLWQKVPMGAEVPVGDWTVNFNDVCFSPDSKYIYVAGNCGLFCFDVATGKILSQWQIGGRFVSVAVSLDGVLVAGGSEISGFVYIYNAKTGKPLLKVVTDQGSLYRLAFSPDSSLLATAGTRRFGLKIWKMPSPASEAKSEVK